MVAAPIEVVNAARSMTQTVLAVFCILEIMDSIMDAGCASHTRQTQNQPMSLGCILVINVARFESITVVNNASI